MGKENLSFKELYMREKKKPSPTQVFIQEVANITKRSPATVKMWLNGNQTPDALTRATIAEWFNVEAETLFKQA